MHHEHWLGWRDRKVKSCPQRHRQSLLILSGFQTSNWPPYLPVYFSLSQNFRNSICRNYLSRPWPSILIIRIISQVFSLHWMSRDREVLRSWFPLQCSGSWPVTSKGSRLNLSHIFIITRSRLCNHTDPFRDLSSTVIAKNVEICNWILIDNTKHLFVRIIWIFLSSTYFVSNRPRDHFTPNRWSEVIWGN